MYRSIYQVRFLTNCFANVLHFHRMCLAVADFIDIMCFKMRVYIVPLSHMYTPCRIVSPNSVCTRNFES